ncbi:hypothetical protein [Thermotoga neapolitana]|uniref:hypothetical protein n=1 Tax=Thermotoga neapolitana TaxID=2337 RepID=UPI000A47093A|nr:hypothetical protein [Thermotoga neapolitana]
MRIDNVSLVRYIEQLYPERTNRTVYRFNSVSELSIQQRLRSQIEGYRSTLSQIYSGIGFLTQQTPDLKASQQPFKEPGNSPFRHPVQPSQRTRDLSFRRNTAGYFRV